ncbi:20999_t:CDS:2, partial [Racocetra persica]
TGDQKFSKKPCLRELSQKINQENNDLCLASSNSDLEYFNAQELLDKKANQKNKVNINDAICSEVLLNKSAEIEQPKIQSSIAKQAE